MKTDTVELPKPDTHCIDEDTGKDVWSHSPEQMREYAAQVAAAENYGLLSLLYDIRVAAGDKGGKLMQDELVASIAALRADAERFNGLIGLLYRENIQIDGNAEIAMLTYGECPDRARVIAAIDAARSAHVEQEQG